VSAFKYYHALPNLPKLADYHAAGNTALISEPQHDMLRRSLGDNDKKMEICHFPPDDPTNFHTITISEKAWPAHMAHGDAAGACGDHCETLCDDGVGAPSYADIVRGVTHDPMTSSKRKLVRFGTAVEDHMVLKLKVSESTKKHATRRSASKQRSLLLAN